MQKHVNACVSLNDNKPTANGQLMAGVAQMQRCDILGTIELIVINHNRSVTAIVEACRPFRSRK